MRHAGAVNLGVDVANQVGLDIEVLNQRQRVVDASIFGVVIEDFLCAIAPQSILEPLTEQGVTHGLTQDRHGVEISINRTACHTLKSCLGPQGTRSPVRLGVQLGKCAKQWATDTLRQGGAHAFFHQMHSMTTITAQRFVATVTRQGDGDVLAGKLADAVSGDGRAVGVGFVVQARQRVDQVKVVALHHLQVVVGMVAVGHHFGELGLVEMGVVKANGAGVDGVFGQARHQRHHGAAVNTA